MLVFLPDGQNKNMDNLVQNYILTIRTAGLTQFLFLYSVIFDFSIYFVLVTLCVALLVYLFRGIRYSLLFLGSLTFGAVLVFILKNLFNVTRPSDGLVYAFGQSFPSYHATIATIFFVMLMYIFDDYLSGLKKVAFNTLCSIAIFGMGLSRVYLGVHWVSDVVTGIMLGCFVCYVSALILRYVRNAA
jgi:undecaprenyl-diphosphatase